MRHVKRATCLFFAAATLALAPLPVLAEKAVDVRIDAALQATATLPAPSSPRILAVLEDVTVRKAKSRDERITGWLDALGTYYAGDTDDLIWVGQNGWSKRAKDVIAELRNARDWGLDPNKFAIPAEPAYGATDDEKAAAETAMNFAVLTYAWHASGGRIAPLDLSLWFDQRGNKVDAISLLRDISSDNDAAAVLRKQHPQHPQFKALHAAYLKLRYPSGSKPKAEGKKPTLIRIPPGKRVKPGRRHPHIALLRQRLGILSTSANETLYDPRLVREVNNFMRTQGWRKKRTFDNKVRTALNNPGGYKKSRRKKSGPITEKQILINMEKWRWMPRELGELHVWNNLPTFRTQVVKNNEVVHEERIIIGKTSMQTPIFTGKMTHVVFKPEWGIPSSIKIKSLLPRLASGDHGVLRRRGMRIDIDGKVVSPSRYNWSKTDITRIPIIQGAGPSNPLGSMKFMFPNKHAVYMHDTPDKHLFKNKTRTHSSGCIRVRNPQRFAEVVMSEAASMTASDVSGYLHRRSKDNNKVDLDRSIPVHNVYFTLVANEDGKLTRLNDIYGHDKRIGRALDGVSPKVIARSDPARAHEARMKQLAAALPRRYQQHATEDPFFNSGPTWSWGFQPKPYNNGFQNGKKKYAKKKKWKPSGGLVRPFWASGE